MSIRHETGWERTGRAGVTLVELVIALVVVGIALSGIFLVFNVVTTSSVDPLVQHQAGAVAESYLDEILARDFEDPDGDDAEVNRANFDDVDDYNDLPDKEVRDLNGTLIGELSEYSVTVTVVNAGFGGVPSADSKRVDVVVSHPSGLNVSMRGYRTRY